ncbi:MAG: GDP-mannose 4,6-dehydratase, partial [Chloroflexota bacterium]
AIVEDVTGGTYNLGTGVEITIKELAEKVISLVERPVNVSLDSTRLRPQKSEVGRLLSDNSLARQELEWKPAISLDEGLRLTIAWIRKHLENYRIGTYEI